MFIRLNKRGQPALEYVMVIAIFVAALIAMQIYFKRGIQGRIREASDDIGGQFSPGYTTSSFTTTLDGSSVETYTQTAATGGTMSETTLSGQTGQTRSGNENVADLGQDDFYTQ